MKNKVRIIARLDIKAPYVVKGIQMEGLKKLGYPHDFAMNYYEQGVDEIIYIDIVASLYNRNSLLDIVTNATENVFIPITVGGGIRSVDDAKKLLRAGADKIAINTAALKNPDIITQLAQAFGSQSVVVSIHAKRIGPQQWEAYYDCGREHTGIDVIEWAKLVEAKGAGEILLTSVDCDGTQQGGDLALVKAVTQAFSIPVIAAGGIGCIQHAVDIIQHSQADAIAIGSALHFNRFSVDKLRMGLQQANIKTRRPEVMA